MAERARDQQRLHICLLDFRGRVKESLFASALAVSMCTVKAAASRGVKSELRNLDQARFFDCAGP